MALKSPTEKLKAADARTHMVVCVWFQAGVGEERYMYKDDKGWYVLSVPCVMGVAIITNQGRCYLTVDADGCFEGVTVDAV